MKLWAWPLVLFLLNCEKRLAPSVGQRQEKKLTTSFDLGNAQTKPQFSLGQHQGRWPDSLFVSCYIKAQNIADVFLQIRIEKSADKILYYRSRLNISDQGEWISLFAGSKFLSWEKQLMPPKIIIELMGVGPHVLQRTSAERCSLTQSWDKRFEHPPKPFFEDFHYPKAHERRILVLGGSTAVDNGGENHFPYILSRHLQALHPQMFEVMNLSSWGMSLLDHRFNLHHMVVTDFPYPYFSNHVYRKYMNVAHSPQRENDGLPQLKPDLVILAAVWNDFALPLFIQPKMLPYFEEMPLTVLYGKLLIDNTLSENIKHKKVEALLSLEVVAEILNAWETDSGRARMLKQYPFLSQKAFAQGIYDHYFLSMKLFIEEFRQAMPRTPLMILTLPFGVYADFTHKDFIVEKTKLSSLGFFIKDKNRFIEFWSEADRIQRQVSMTFHRPQDKIYFFDLSQLYHSQVEKLAPKTYFDLGIFSFDLMHFSDYGNNYVANYLYPEVLKILPP